MRRMISSVLAIVMVLVSVNIAVPVSAHQNITFGTDFTDYVGIWNGTTVTTGGAMPSMSGGGFQNESTQTAVSGGTNGTAADAKYGNSVKVYSAYSETINSTSGAKFALNTSNYLKHSAYFEGSMYAEKPADGKVGAPRSFRIHGLNQAGTASNQV